ncbi:unnamed protein product [Larinioides sclopetarius]|uniref:Uncharacterized protein n=1 Tax=Larinioides sclopetarius TaxID=280406 RepID=A0AAV2AWZ4_9ARAC
MAQKQAEIDQNYSQHNQLTLNADTICRNQSNKHLDGQHLTVKFHKLHSYLTISSGQVFPSRNEG